MDGMCISIRLQIHFTQLLWASSTMDNMTFSCLLTRANTLMTDEKEFVEPIAVIVQLAEIHDGPNQALIIIAITPTTVFQHEETHESHMQKVCMDVLISPATDVQDNHFGKECQYQHEETHGYIGLSTSQIGLHRIRVLKKWNGGHNLSTSIPSTQVMKEAHPVIEVCFDIVECTTQVNSGYSWMLPNRFWFVIRGTDKK